MSEGSCDCLDLKYVVCQLDRGTKDLEWLRSPGLDMGNTKLSVGTRFGCEERAP
jgi:hypothetical protein